MAGLLIVPQIERITTVTNDRIALRLEPRDYEHLLAIAEAIRTAPRPADTAPWTPAISVSRCVRLALKVAAEVAQSGATLTAMEVPIELQPRPGRPAKVTHDVG